MTKYNQLTQAEHLYIYDKKSLAEIGMQLGLSRRILFYWKKEYKWDEKRLEVEHTKYRFSNELIDFARKMMNKFPEVEFFDCCQYPWKFYSSFFLQNL